MTNIKSIELYARAKINISLDVLGVLPNGYHDLRMIMQSVGLSDTVYIEKLPEMNNLTCIEMSDPKIPSDESNLAWKAAEAMRKHYGFENGIYIRIEKNIPSAAGLAGGSSDCAAVLNGINSLFGINAADAELAAIGLKIGADVPYCLRGGTMLAEGVGERLTPLASFPECSIVLSKPDYDVSTPKVFKAYDAAPQTEHPDTDRIISLIEKGDISAVAAGMKNVLEPVTKKEIPVIESIEKIMLEDGALGAVMSGSGPTVFGIFDSPQTAERSADRIRRELGIKETYVTFAI